MPHRASPASPACARASSAGRRGAALAAALLAWTSPAAAAPERVVSMNVCTDQLAMLLAAPGQLASVSWLARDPNTSAMVAEAQAYPVNHGLAEEVFVMQPDLVLAGSYTARPAIELLQRLGFDVIEFAPETSIEDIRANLRRMGAALGREARAEAVIAELDAALATVPPARGEAPRAALYEANAYTTGSGALSDAVLRAAGFTNLAAELGIAGLARLPLEVLVMAAPDLVITGDRYEPPSLGEAILDHPALAQVQAAAAPAVVPGSAWVCGTPATAAAVAQLAALRAELAADD